MNTVLAAAAFFFIAYSVLNLSERPGLFAGISANTYALAIHFGSIGGPIGILAILAGLTGWNRFGSIKPGELALLAWMALSLLTVPFSPQIDIAASYAVALIFLSASGFALGRATGASPGFMRDLFLSASLVVILCEPTIATTPTVGGSTRLSGDLNAVGVSELVDIPIVGCLTYLLLDRSLRGWRRFGLAVFLFVVVLPTAVSFGTRGVFVGLGVALFLLLLVRLFQGRISALMRDFAFLTAAAGVIGYALWVYFPLTRLVVPIAARLVVNFASSGGNSHVLDQSGLERLRFYSEAKDLILAAPWFGHGLGAFSYLANYASGSYPHNAVLEILVNNGVVGLALFAIGVVLLFRSSVSEAFAKLDDCEDWLLVGLLVYTFARLQISESITHGKLFFLLLGVAGARASYRSSSDDRRPAATAVNWSGA